jgi:hypothetical protein
MRQDAPQPGEPFGLGRAVEARKILVGFEHGLLHQVRGIDLGAQPAFDLRAGDDADVIAAHAEQAVERLGIPLSRPREQAADRG